MERLDGPHPGFGGDHSASNRLFCRPALSQGSVAARLANRLQRRLMAQQNAPAVRFHPFSRGRSLRGLPEAIAPDSSTHSTASEQTWADRALLRSLCTRRVLSCGGIIMNDYEPLGADV